MQFGVITEEPAAPRVEASAGTDDTLSVDEVATILGISRHAVYQRVRRKELSGVIRIGRSIKFNSKVFKNSLSKTEPVLSPERSGR